MTHGTSTAMAATFPPFAQPMVKNVPSVTVTTHVTPSDVVTACTAPFRIGPPRRITLLDLTADVLTTAVAAPELICVLPANWLFADDASMVGRAFNVTAPSSTTVPSTSSVPPTWTDPVTYSAGATTRRRNFSLAISYPP